MNRLAIRWRLTLWYSGILGIILLLFSAGIYYRMRDHLLSRMDRSLQEELTGIDEELEESSTTDGLRARLHRRFGHYEHLLFDVRYADGSAPLFSRRLGDQLFPSPAAANAPEKNAVITYQAVNGERWRIASREVAGPTERLLTRVAGSLTADEHEMAQLLATLLVIGPLAMAGALVGGYLLARRALDPIDRMARAAHDISVRQLDQRIHVYNPHDELGRLAATLNEMIARLEKSFADMQQFTADAAHELRTPVTVIRNEAEVALRIDRSAEEYRKSLECLLEEAESLTRLADQLLYLCREDAGTERFVRSEVRLDQVAGDVAEHIRVLAQEKHIELDSSNMTPCQVQGDADRLRRLLFNLLDNAVKYTPFGGVVTLEVNRTNGDVEMIVADTGVGIPAEHLPQIFNRFYRVDAARQSGGTGLGLAISRAIVESHGGTIKVESRVGLGTRITVGFKSEPANH